MTVLLSIRMDLNYIIKTESMSDTNKRKVEAWNHALRVLFDEEHERAEEQRKLEARNELMKQEAIDWLVRHGVDIELIQRLLDQGKLEVATIEEAKREYLRLIEMCDKWDGVDLDFLLDNIEKKILNDLSPGQQLENYIRKILKARFNKYTEEELIKRIETKFSKRFKFEWVRGYTRKDKTVVETYVRIQFL